MSCRGFALKVSPALAVLLCALSGCRTIRCTQSPVSQADTLLTITRSSGGPAWYGAQVTFTVSGDLRYTYGRPVCVRLSDNEMTKLRAILKSQAFQDAFERLIHVDYRSCCSDQPHVAILLNGHSAVLPLERLNADPFGAILKKVDRLLASALHSSYELPIVPVVVK